MFSSPTRASLALASALSLALLAGCESGQPQAAARGGPPPAVTVVTLESQEVELTTELPGRAVALRKAEVRPQISGIIEQRLFEEGAEVKAGQQLYQIAPARYQAALQTAEADLAAAKAQLESASAQHTRLSNLLKQKLVSQQEYDSARAAFLEAEAAVAQGEAAVRTARIDLDYTRVIAPISGRIGKSEVTEGALVSAQQSAVLATINQLDPIYVDLAQPAKNILALRRETQQGQLNAPVAARVHLKLEDGSDYEHTGELKFSEMSVNESTGTVVVRAVVPNPEHMLLPGMFVRATVDEATRPNALLVPQRGVSRDRQGNATALVVNAENKVEMRTLSASRAIGDSWLVESGLHAGDRVIVEGLQQVRPGAEVSVNERAEATETALTQAGE